MTLMVDGPEIMDFDNIIYGPEKTEISMFNGGPRSYCTI